MSSNFILGDNIEEENEKNEELISSKEKELLDKTDKFQSLVDISKYFSTLHKGIIRLRMILLISDSEDENEIIEEFKRYYRVSKLSDLYKLERIDSNSVKEKSVISFVGFLWFSPTISYSIIFTFGTQETINKDVFTYFLNKSRIVTPLWVNQKITYELINFLQNTFEGTIKSCYGVYLPLFHRKSETRPIFPRKISYIGNDSYQSLFEMKKSYGINIERFSATLFDLGLCEFNRKLAIFVLREGELETFIQISQWLYDRSNNYIKEIKKFKKIIYDSIFSNRNHKISNNLSFEFKDPLTPQIINEIIKEIKNSENIKINSIHSSVVGNEPFFNIKILNQLTKGTFRLIISCYFANVIQVFNVNFVSVLPVLDILDSCQPDNLILIKG